MNDIILHEERSPVCLSRLHFHFIPCKKSYSTTKPVVSLSCHLKLTVGDISTQRCVNRHVKHHKPHIGLKDMCVLMAVKALVDSKHPFFKLVFSFLLKLMF